MGLTPTIAEDLTGAFTRQVSFSTTALWMSVHSGDPGTIGSNEVSSVFGRQSVAFSGSGGVDTNSSAVSFQFSSAVGVSWVGYWNQQTGGTFLGGFPLVGPPLLATSLDGSATLSVPAHGLSVGSAVRPYAVPGVAGSAVPLPLSEDSQYLVTAVPTLDSLQLIHSGSTVISMGQTEAFQLCTDLSQVFPASGGVLVFPPTSGITYETVSVAS